MLLYRTIMDLDGCMAGRQGSHAHTTWLKEIGHINIVKRGLLHGGRGMAPRGRLQALMPITVCVCGVGVP